MEPKPCSRGSKEYKDSEGHQSAGLASGPKQGSSVEDRKSLAEATLNINEGSADPLVIQPELTELVD